MASESGPELKYDRFLMASDVWGKVPSDFAERGFDCSLAQVNTPTQCTLSTLRVIKVSTPLATKLLMSRSILVHSVWPQRRLSEMWGTSRLERNILTVRIFMTCRICWKDVVDFGICGRIGKIV